MEKLLCCFLFLHVGDSYTFCFYFFFQLCPTWIVISLQTVRKSIEVRNVGNQSKVVETVRIRNEH